MEMFESKRAQDEFRNAHAPRDYRNENIISECHNPKDFDWSECIRIQLKKARGVPDWRRQWQVAIADEDIDDYDFKRDSASPDLPFKFCFPFLFPQ